MSQSQAQGGLINCEKEDVLMSSVTVEDRAAGARP